MNREEFEALLDEYRARDIHFLHLKTATRDWFFVIDDSYYLTYRDDKKEIVISLLIKPRDDKHEDYYFYNTNNRSFDEWNADVCERYNKMDGKEFYHAPHYENIFISYMNENEKVPLKDFLAVVPRTDYMLFGNYLLCDEIGSGLDKSERSYRTDDSTIGAQIRYWLNFEDIKPFNYVLRDPVNSPAINLGEIEEIIPAHTSVRFIFDNGSVKVLKRLLDNEADASEKTAL